MLRAGDCRRLAQGRHRTAITCATRATTTASFIVVGGGANTGGGYSDIDMTFTPDGGYVHKDGTPY